MEKGPESQRSSIAYAFEVREQDALVIAVFTFTHERAEVQVQELQIFLHLDSEVRIRFSLSLLKMVLSFFSKTALPVPIVMSVGVVG